MADKVSLNNAKTEFMLTGSRRRLPLQNDQQIEIQIDGKNISLVKNAKSLGVFTYDKLNWKKHVDDISTRTSSGISALKDVRHWYHRMRLKIFLIPLFSQNKYVCM